MSIEEYRKDLDVVIRLLELAKDTSVKDDWCSFDRCNVSSLNKDSMKRTRLIIHDILIKHEVIN